MIKTVGKIWMAIGKVMGWVMTRVILTVLFYLVVAPISLLARLFGKKFLDLAFKKQENSYWVPKEKPAADKSAYERQF